MDNCVELKIYNIEDRLNVAQILIKNGYSVQQIKKKRSDTGKAVDYFLRIKEGDEDAAESR